MTDDPKTSRCRAGSETQRCSFRGDRDELRDHADEMGHQRCIVPRGKESDGEPRRCATALAWYEQQACDNCVRRVRDDLVAVAVAYAHLERVILQTALRMGGEIPGGNALVLFADGSTQGGGPDDWLTDPTPVLAILEANERDWRHEFGHGPAVNVATVAGCLAYLRDWHLIAAKTHPGFDDYAAEIRELRSRLEHVVGTADDPAKGAPCACGTTLLRDYGQDDWACPGCGAAVERSAYMWRLRLASHLPGWVSVSEAAEAVGRPMRTVQTWARNLEIPVVCMRVTKRVLVELAGVKERSDEVEHRERRAS